MVTTTAKVSDKGFVDVVKSGVTVRCFYTYDHVLVIRPDVIIDKTVPYTPVVVKVNTNNETVFNVYRDVVSRLLLDDSYSYVFSRTGDFRNTFEKNDRDSIVRIVTTAHKKWYSLQCMQF